MNYFSTIVKFVVYDPQETGEETICVNSYHENLKSVSHVKRIKRCHPIHFSGDTSTEIAINVIEKRWKQLYISRYVTSNHFDIDAFLAVWCLINPSEAIKYKDILIEAAKIDDLREMNLSKDNTVIPNSTTDKALKLCCWILELEKKYFWKTYEKNFVEFEECYKKYNFFLSKLTTILEDIDSNNLQLELYKTSYNKIISDIEFLYTNENTKIEKWEDLGIAVVFVDKPLHYYALFHPACNMDTVITVYPDNKYEIEDKYSSFIQLTSRKSWPRIPLESLTTILNKKESRYIWGCDGVRTLGKITQLYENTIVPKNYVTDYEGPCSRNILSSDLKSDEFLNLVKSFYTFSKNKSPIKYPKIYWSWEEITEIVMSVPWNEWITQNT
jgi:hypothetical protein